MEGIYSTPQQLLTSQNPNAKYSAILLHFAKDVEDIMKGICHSLFVITRTQLNLNKIVISKQY